MELRGGRWELDACQSLTGRLNGALSLPLSAGAAGHPDTLNAAAQSVALCQAAFTSRQLGASETNSSSCLCSANTLGHIPGTGENIAEHDWVRSSLPGLSTMDCGGRNPTNRHPSMCFGPYGRSIVTHSIGDSKLSQTVIIG